MFGKRFHLFTIYGFRIGIDSSWFFLAVLVTWSFGVQVFPALYEHLPRATHWLMGAATALGLFASIVFHEMSHSIIARRHGVVMRGITLFIFGGVAEMTDEPPSPKAEFQVAIAGPIASLLLVVVCFSLGWIGTLLGWTEAITGVVDYLAQINSYLVIFNLIPAFPLDGGRVLRSIVWQWKKNLSWATYVTSRIGVGFAFALIGAGVLIAMRVNLVSGLWLCLIGLFLRGAANMSYQQLLLRRSLEGESVRRFMRVNPVTVPADITVASLVDDYIYRFHFKMFPVIDGEKLFGCVRTREIKELPRELWAQRRVRDVAIELCEENSIGPDVDAIVALSKMNQARISRLMVVEGDRLVGIITLKDLLQFLSLKVELEQS